MSRPASVAQLAGPPPLRSCCALVAGLLLAAEFGCGRADYLLEQRASTSDQSGARSGVERGGAGGSGGSVGQLRFECGLPAASQDFPLCAARNVGSTNDDRLAAVALGRDRRLWVAGAFGELPGVPTKRLDNGTQVALLELAPDTLSPIRGIRLPGGARALQVDPIDGQLVIGGDFGVMSLSPDASTVRWRQPIGVVSRLALDQAGGIAALIGAHQVEVLRAGGVRETSLRDDGSELLDVALDSRADALYVVGSRQVTSGTCMGTVPVLRRYALSGVLVWRDYEFADPKGLCASSRGLRLVVKGQILYYVGDNEGGNSVHSVDPKNVALALPPQSGDEYSVTWGKAIRRYAFLGEFSVTDGKLLARRFLLPRDAHVGGQLLVSSLAVDAAGRVIVGGQTSCCIADRDTQTVAGQSLATFGSDEANVATFSADLSTRLAWHVFTRQGDSPSTVVGLAVGTDYVLVAAQLISGLGRLTTWPELDSPRLGGADGWLAAWSR